MPGALTSEALTSAGDHRWREAGEGPALVLVHGIGGSTANWVPVIEPLARTHRVYAWAFPGYEGAAPLPAESPGAEDYAARLLDFLDQRGIEDAHVVGHSLGAVVAAALARAAPGRVRRISYVCPVLGGGVMPAEQREAVRKGRADEIAAGGMTAFAEARTASIVGPGIAPDALADIIATMARIPVAAYLQAWEMLCAADIRALIDPAIAPAAVLGGEVDPVAPPDAVKQVAAACRTTPEVLPAIGHFPAHEAPGALIAFLGAPADAAPSHSSNKSN